MKNLIYLFIYYTISFIRLKQKGSHWRVTLNGELNMQ